MPAVVDPEPEAGRRCRCNWVYDGLCDDPEALGHMAAVQERGAGREQEAGQRMGKEQESMEAGRE